MSRTSGGLVKSSVTLTPEEAAWCRAQSEAHGRCGIAAVIRMAIRAAMQREQPARDDER